MSIKDSGGFNVTRRPDLDASGRKTYVVDIHVDNGQWVQLTYGQTDLQEIRRIIGQALKEDA
ncbi:MAG TPA: hypothetical protein K8W03_07360 [Bifidobacterium pseudolongum subsp. globosum]|nr:hypothetical protein [Bifidobacterium pseudolongum subsp. globosum]